MGFKKVADIFYQDWERVDNNQEKREKIIRKAIEEAKIIE